VKIYINLSILFLISSQRNYTIIK